MGITEGSIVARPGGTFCWRVQRVFQELMTHRMMCRCVPAGEAWNKETIDLPIEAVRLVVDLEDMPA